MNEQRLNRTDDDIKALQERIAKSAEVFDKIRAEMSRVVVGQQQMIDRLLIGLLGNGHVMLEGVPGLAKTLSIKTLAQTVDAGFSRIQFTPDLLPADVVGTMIYNQQTHGFEVRKGPIFAHFILADEINRAPAKVQSALLEAMQERQVTIGDETYPLEEPFLVLATQNPLEQEGTYPLPEAQEDRFMLKVVVGYPERDEEREIIRRQTSSIDPQMKVRQVATAAEILQARELVRQVYLDEKIEEYIIDMVFATRFPGKYNLSKLQPLIAYGASPRASINLALAARAQAYLQHRGFVIPDDVRSIAKDVLRHRIGLTYEAEAENVTVETIIDDIMRTLVIP